MAENKRQCIGDTVVMAADLGQELAAAVGECHADRLFVLTDETTRQLCLPIVEGYECLRGAEVITIPAGDENKNLESVTHVWSQLQRGGATRHSLMVNLGGGMVTDLGGFAASTFKRGVQYINIPTTLLSMVDASVGGKTGFNFGGLKNEIGVFSNARRVILDTVFLRTLDNENILSGYAEMLKHGLISDAETWAGLLEYDPLGPDAYALGTVAGKALRPDADAPGTVAKQEQLRQMLYRSVWVKQRIVEEDPTEKGLRKALNLGHTVGHAFEALALSGGVQTQGNDPAADGGNGVGERRLRPVLHGYAVAYGLVCELYLSVMKTGFPVDKMRQTVNFITSHYGRMPITCDHYPALLELMTHDKKNTAGTINFTLLGDIGDIRINQTATKEEITEALDFYRDGN